ncbi:MAG: ABC transporter permease [Candidatus Synoicihabitans palmerolidicus]|nr:ABC transporter permease [Candidatus Synoicihabitans palmerolidicus]
MLGRSLHNVMAVDVGFDSGRVIIGHIALSGAYRDSRDNIDLQRRVQAALQSIPGGERVGHRLGACVGRRTSARALRPSHHGRPRSGEQPMIHIATVSPEFFATLGVPLKSGRNFTSADNFAHSPVASVDESLVNRDYPDRPVEGDELYLSRGLPLAEDGWTRVVGVVGPTRLNGLDRPNHLPTVYVPLVDFPVKTGFWVLVRSPRPDAWSDPGYPHQATRHRPRIAVLCRQHATGTT